MSNIKTNTVAAIRHLTALLIRKEQEVPVGDGNRLAGLFTDDVPARHAPPGPVTELTFGGARHVVVDSHATLTADGMGVISSCRLLWVAPEAGDHDIQSGRMPAADKEVQVSDVNAAPTCVAPPRAEVNRTESAADALRAVQCVLDNDPVLAKLVSATIPLAADRQVCVLACSKCGGGHLHAVGGNRTPSGKPVLGGLFVCAACGHHERRR